MAVSNYKADEKEAARNRKKLAALIKKPENQICMDCPIKRECPVYAAVPTRARCVSGACRLLFGFRNPSPSHSRARCARPRRLGVPPQ